MFRLWSPRSITQRKLNEWSRVSNASEAGIQNEPLRGDLNALCYHTSFVERVARKHPLLHKSKIGCDTTVQTTRSRHTLLHPTRICPDMRGARFRPKWYTQSRALESWVPLWAPTGLLETSGPEFGTRFGAAGLQGLDLGEYGSNPRPPGGSSVHLPEFGPCQRSGTFPLTPNP